MNAEWNTRNRRVLPTRPARSGTSDVEGRRRRALGRSWRLAAVAVGSLFAAQALGATGAPLQDLRQSLSLSAMTTQEIALRGGEGGALSLDLQLGSRPVTITLTPRSLRAPNFTVLAVDAEGARAVEVDPPATYRGVVEGEPESLVAARVRDGRVNALVRLGAETWYVQPALAAADRAAARAAQTHAVYRGEDVIPDGHGCGGAIAPDGAAPAQGGIAGGGAGEVCNLLCQIAFDADVEFFLANDASVENTVADIELVMSGVEAIYLIDTGVSYQITTIIVRTEEPDPYDTSGPSPLLATFRDHWNANHDDVPRDVAHFMTGRNLQGTTIGIAYLAQLCDLDMAYGLSQSKWTNNLAARVALTAHELGHNWSCPHCNADPECSIMCSSLGGCTGEITFFNPSSAFQIMQFANNASCLGPGPQTAPMAHDDVLFAAAGTSTVLDVLANDLELNCDPLVFDGLPAQTAAGGTVEPCLGCLPGGKDGLLYTPPDGYLGADAFGYTVVDPLGASDEAEVSLTIVEMRPSVGPVSTSPGLLSTYYATPGATALPDFEALTPLSSIVISLINFPPTTGEFAFSGLSDEVGCVFEGYLEAPTTDIYTLYLESSDGSRLYFGDDLIVDNDGIHDMVEASGVVGLQAGKHPVRIEFFESTGQAGVIARWKSSTLAKGIIPSFWWSWSESAGPADLNGDGVVDGADLGILLGAWGGAGAGDLDGSGEVDGADLGLLLGAWSA